MRPEDLFPAPPAENHWTGDPYWNLQLGAYSFAVQLSKTLPAGSRLTQALWLLRQCLTEAQADLRKPTSFDYHRRLRQTLAPYGETPWLTLFAMLHLADLHPRDILYDLGCGPGRLILFAAAYYGCRTVGLEIDTSLYDKAMWRSRNMYGHVADRVRVMHADVNDHWPEIQRDATVVMVFWVSTTMRAHIDLFKALRPGTRIISNTFDFGPDWPADTIIEGPPSAAPYRILKWTV